MKGLRLVVSDKCAGLVEALGQVFPQADWQRCVVHWCRTPAEVFHQRDVALRM